MDNPVASTKKLIFKSCSTGTPRYFASRPRRYFKRSSSFSRCYLIQGVSSITLQGLGDWIHRSWYWSLRDETNRLIEDQLDGTWHIRQHPAQPHRWVVKDLKHSQILWYVGCFGSDRANPVEVCPIGKLCCSCCLHTFRRRTRQPPCGTPRHPKRRKMW